MDVNHIIGCKTKWDQVGNEKQFKKNKKKQI